MIIRERKYFNGNQICDKQITEQQLEVKLRYYLEQSKRHETKIQTYTYAKQCRGSQQRLLKRVTITVNYIVAGTLSIDYTIKHDWKERDL